MGASPVSATNAAAGECRRARHGSVVSDTRDHYGQGVRNRVAIGVLAEETRHSTTGYLHHCRGVQSEHGVVPDHIGFSVVNVVSLQWFRDAETYGVVVWPGVSCPPVANTAPPAALLEDPADVLPPEALPAPAGRSLALLQAALASTANRRFLSSFSYFSPRRKMESSQGASHEFNLFGWRSCVNLLHIRARPKLSISGC